MTLTVGDVVGGMSPDYTQTSCIRQPDFGRIANHRWIDMPNEWWYGGSVQKKQEFSGERGYEHI